MKINLLDFNRAALKDYVVALGAKSFHADQIFKWLYQRDVADVSRMTDLSKSLRSHLEESCEILGPKIAEEQCAKDGTIKWKVRLHDANCVESVFIPEEDRGTLCISSQVGCALNCTFCSTARQGFNRNLTVGEIIGQVRMATQRLAALDDSYFYARRITNVVMMGMGEPLLNFDAVVAAMDIMMDDLAYGLSKRRVTLSTSGVVPMMHRLKELSEASLAVSLHAPTNELRNILVPINKKYPIEELMAVCREYFKVGGKRKIMFEYVMLEGVNDSIVQAKQLVALLREIHCMVNLIPFNPFPDTVYKRSSNNRIHAFQEILAAADITCITRRTRGDDIDAACGQLVGKVEDRTSRSRLMKKQVVMTPQAGTDLS
jgi:23S rRNA (adenine2503-C2)-methyltransferase